jgi:RNA polymerase sigma-70 factor, ECF subfamily
MARGSLTEDMDNHLHNNRVAAGLRAGDREAWLELYNAYAQRVWSNTSRLMSDKSSVADVVQETFLAAARSARSYDPRRGPLWVWLWTIARRQIALHYRRQKPTVSLDAALEWFTSLNGRQREMLSQMEAPLEMLESKELATLVRHCLGELPADYEQVLLGVYVDEMPVKEIAKQLSCSTVAVRSRIARAKKAFRSEFARVTQSNPVFGRQNNGN